MQKKLIALAIASAISAPAFADNANVTFYGKLIADVESVKSDKSTIPPFTAPATGASYTTNRVVSDASRFGIKGEDDLGNGLKAIFQIETQVELGGGSATFTSVRNTGAGLKDEAMGTVMIANWDTPYKLTHNKIELFDNTTFASATNLIGRSAAVGAVATVNAAASSDSFVTRKSGVVQYYSPKFSGFDVKVAYAPASDTYVYTAPATNGSGANAATKQNQALLSFSGTFETEQLYVAVGYESHNDALTPTATRGTGANSATRVVGSYKIMDNLWVGGTVEKLAISSANLAGTGVDKNSRTGVELAIGYKDGANNIGLSYAKQGDLGSAKDTGATQLSLRYGFDLSKRTQVFAMYSTLSNKTAGQYALSAGQTIASAAGAKYSGFGAGLQHTF
jgi:predicted porin